MTNLIVIQMLNSVCIIILKMLSDLQKLVCYAAISMLQAVGTGIGLFFPVVCCLTALTPRPIHYSKLNLQRSGLWLLLQ